MLNDDICKLRERLNESIINNEDYNITYKNKRRTRRTNCKILQNNNNTKEPKETKKKKNKYKRKYKNCLKMKILREIHIKRFIILLVISLYFYIFITN